jgi:Fe-S cluster assembly protein SufD
MSTAPFIDAVKKAQAAAEATAALASLRDGALERFAAQGLPTRRHEEWKYTSTDVLKKLSGDPQPGDAQLPVATGAALNDEVKALVDDVRLPGAHVVVVVGGHVVDGLADLPDGVCLGALHKGAGSVAPGSLAAADMGPLVALNASLATDGVVIELSGNTVLQQPLQIVQLPVPGQKSLSCPRHTVILGANAKATVIETWTGDGTEAATASVTEVSLAEGASLDYLTWSTGAAAGDHRFGTLKVRQERSSTFTSRTFWFGGQLNRHDLSVDLAGEGAECHLDGLFITGGAMHVDNHTSVDHLVPHCTSRQLYKGVLGGRSHGVFNGKVFFREGATKSDTEQANHNLLVSLDAQIDTKPQLEIFNDDVKASHGSTVGQLDEAAVFYCTSRGISRRDAEHMLIEAFADEMLLDLADGSEDGGPLKRRIEADLKSRLDAALPSGELPGSHA